ncbi:MAG: hypothetical protein NTY41_16375 [Proteobacteria bacterium]|nr:hypothetical protein [Pseudomonadota bacterium]
MLIWQGRQSSSAGWCFAGWIALLFLLLHVRRFLWRLVSRPELAEDLVETLKILVAMHQRHASSRMEIATVRDIDMLEALTQLDQIGGIHWQSSRAQHLTEAHDMLQQRA